MAGLGALAKDIKVDSARPDSPLDFPVAASTRLYAGGLVATNTSGYAVPAAADVTLSVWGPAKAGVDNTTGTAGQKRVEVERGIFYVFNGTAADAITIADCGQFAFALDDQTVSRTSNGNTRPIVGVIVGVRADGKIGVVSATA